MQFVHLTGCFCSIKDRTRHFLANLVEFRGSKRSFSVYNTGVHLGIPRLKVKFHLVW